MHPWRFHRFSALIPVCVLSMALLMGCNKQPSAASAGSPPNAKGPGGRGGGEVPVTVTKVVRKDIPVEIQVVGNVEAFSTITVKAQVAGELTKVYFKEGDYVKQGTPLFSIDRRLIESELNQVQANIIRQTAFLKQSEANLARDMAQEQYARQQMDRYAQLAKEGIFSKEQAEQQAVAANVAAQTVIADRAAIDSAKADIEATKATLENSRLKLSYAEIRSPIDGRTGNVLIKQGNLVAPNTTDLTTINQVQPIYVTFSVPESQLPAIKNSMAVGRLPVYSKPQDETAPPEQGYLAFVDNTVDVNTGTIKLKGVFENEHLKLWPGQFVRVTLRLSTQANALILPNQAIQTGQEGPYVYVVKEDRTVESRKVATGGRLDQELVIEDGVKFGETVVLDGQLRLAPGMKVSVREPGSGPRGVGRKKGAS